jgi:hypothetical protein
MTSIDNINAALVDVRKAYRLLYLYQRSVLCLTEEIAGALGFEFFCWQPYFDRPSTRKKSPSEKWVWDMLPMYKAWFLFSQEASDPNKPKNGECFLEISLLSDNGYPENADNEPNPLEFEKTVADSDTCIKLAVFQAVEDLDHDWCYFWKEYEYSAFPSIGIETVADKEYRLAELSDQESLNSVLKNFQSIWHNEEEH